MADQVRHDVTNLTAVTLEPKGIGSTALSRPVTLEPKAIGSIDIIDSIARLAAHSKMTSMQKRFLFPFDFAQGRLWLERHARLDSSNACVRIG